MRIVLHIGTDKTGSSSIQQHLTQNYDWFLDKGIYVPRTIPGVSKGHSNLLEQGEPPFWGLQVHLGNAYKIGCSTFLLSWEGMSFYTAGQLRELVVHLGNNDIEVLAYLREQADILQSGLLQQIKTLSNAIPLRKLIKPFALWEQPLRDWLRSDTRDYHRLLLTWRAEIPRAQFRIRLYERSKLLQGSVVDDFLEQLGATPDKEFRRIEQPANPSLDVESALLVEKWQGQGLAQEQLRHYLDVVQSMMACQGGGTRYFLDGEAVAYIREGFRRSNQLLARDFLSAPDVSFSLENPCCRDIALEELEQRMALLEERVENQPI